MIHSAKPSSSNCSEDPTSKLLQKSKMDWVSIVSNKIPLVETEKLNTPSCSAHNDGTESNISFRNIAIINWEKSEICNFLDSVALISDDIESFKIYKHKLFENGVSGCALLLMEDRHFEKIGIKLPHQLNIMSELQKLKKSPVNTPPSIFSTQTAAPKHSDSEEIALKVYINKFRSFTQQEGPTLEFKSYLALPNLNPDLWCNAISNKTIHLSLGCIELIKFVLAASNTPNRVAPAYIIFGIKEAKRTFCNQPLLDNIEHFLEKTTGLEIQWSEIVRVIPITIEENLCNAVKVFPSRLRMPLVSAITIEEPHGNEIIEKDKIYVRDGSRSIEVGKLSLKRKNDWKIEPSQGRKEICDNIQKWCNPTLKVDASSFYDVLDYASFFNIHDSQYILMLDSCQPFGHELEYLFSINWSFIVDIGSQMYSSYNGVASAISLANKYSKRIQLPEFRSIHNFEFPFDNSTIGENSKIWLWIGASTSTQNDDDRILQFKKNLLLNGTFSMNSLKQTFIVAFFLYLPTLKESEIFEKVIYEFSTCLNYYKIIFLFEVSPRYMQDFQIFKSKYDKNKRTIFLINRTTFCNELKIRNSVELCDIPEQIQLSNGVCTKINSAIKEMWFPIFTDIERRLLSGAKVAETPKDFYLGNSPISWLSLNNNVDVKRNVAEFIEIYIKANLLDQNNIILKLHHEPNSGATTVARRVAFNLRKVLPVFFLQQNITEGQLNRAVTLLENYYSRLYKHSKTLLILDGHSESLCNQLHAFCKKINICFFILHIKRCYDFSSQGTAQDGVKEYFLFHLPKQGMNNIEKLKHLDELARFYLKFAQFAKANRSNEGYDQARIFEEKYGTTVEEFKKKYTKYSSSLEDSYLLSPLFFALYAFVEKFSGKKLYIYRILKYKLSKNEDVLKKLAYIALQTFGDGKFPIANISQHEEETREFLLDDKLKLLLYRANGEFKFTHVEFAKEMLQQVQFLLMKDFIVWKDYVKGKTRGHFFNPSIFTQDFLYFNLNQAMDVKQFFENVVSEIYYNKQKDFLDGAPLKAIPKTIKFSALMRLVVENAQEDIFKVIKNVFSSKQYDFRILTFIQLSRYYRFYHNLEQAESVLHEAKDFVDTATSYTHEYYYAYGMVYSDRFKQEYKEKKWNKSSKLFFKKAIQSFKKSRQYKCNLHSYIVPIILYTYLIEDTIKLSPLLVKPCFLKLLQSEFAPTDKYLNALHIDSMSLVNEITLNDMVVKERDRRVCYKLMRVIGLSDENVFLPSSTSFQLSNENYFFIVQLQHTYTNWHEISQKNPVAMERALKILKFNVNNTDFTDPITRDTFFYNWIQAIAHDNPSQSLDTVLTLIKQRWHYQSSVFSCFYHFVLTCCKYLLSTDNSTLINEIRLYRNELKAMIKLSQKKFASIFWVEFLNPVNEFNSIPTIDCLAHHSRLLSLKNLYISENMFLFNDQEKLTCFKKAQYFIEFILDFLNC